MGLLDLLQIADSAFPTGAFSHSWGLEGVAQAGLAGLGYEQRRDGHEAALHDLLQARIACELARTDLPLLLAANRAGIDASLDALLALDAIAVAARAVREWREASARTGRRLLAAVQDFAPHAILGSLLAGSVGEPPGPQLPIAFGLAAQRLDCDAHAAATAYAANATLGQLAAAVRLGLTGQRAVQHIYHQLKPAIESAIEYAASVSLDEVGGGMPLLEIAGMRHEGADERLFAS